MKDRKRFLAPRDLWDAGTLEAWLEEKAAQGWILEKWGISARFERIDPCRCRVRLDPKGQRNRQQQAEAETLYRDMGWRWNGTLWFYDVYYCFDPTAPDLYTEPASQAWAWEKLLKQTVQRNVLALLLLAVWTALQFDDLFSNHVVELFLRGMWAVWLFVVLYVGRELCRLARQILGVRHQRQRLEAGVPLERGDPARAVKRQMRTEVFSWTMIVLLCVVFMTIVVGRREMPLSDAPEPLPAVTLETLSPEEAVLPMDSERYERARSLLATWYTSTQFQWDGPYWEAELAQVHVEPLAALLYREWLDNARDRLPEAAVTELADSRFDQAVLLDNGIDRDGRSVQILLVRRGGTVLTQEVCLHTDLSGHLDGFAAVLAAFQ